LEVILEVRNANLGYIEYQPLRRSYNFGYCRIIISYIRERKEINLWNLTKKPKEIKGGI
jgi:hypothetical protein